MSSAISIQMPHPSDRPLTALQLFLDNPFIGLQDWCRETGLKARMYYTYRARAAAAQSGDAPAPNASAEADASFETHTKHRRARRVTVQDASADLRDADQFGTAVVTDVRMRNAILLGIFCAATLASVENMYRTIGTFCADWFSNVTLTAVFSMTAMAFMLSGVRTKYTIAIIAALVAFEGLCNATSVFGGLYDVHSNAGNEFLLRFTELVYWFSPKHCAQAIAIFCAACIASVQFFAIKEVRNPRTEARLVAVRS